MLSRGTVLITLDGQAYTNAIVLNSTFKTTILLSDFGNEIELATDSIFDRYAVSKNFIEAKSIGYPIPTVEERIKQQISLLQHALAKC
jgi:hypothetical protein